MKNEIVWLIIAGVVAYLLFQKNASAETTIKPSSTTPSMPYPGNDPDNVIRYL